MRQKIRVKRHRFNQKLVGFIMKRMALRLLSISNLHQMNDEGIYPGLDITYYPNGYDTYTSCKSPNKKYCGKRNCHYVAYIGGYSFYGNTLSEMYCNIVGRLVLNAPQFPFCTMRLFPPKMEIHYRKHVMIGTASVLVPTDKNFNKISV